MTKKINIFITGATGFIGTHLINQFDNESYTIYALTRNDYTSKSGNLIYIKGDIFNLTSCSDILKTIDYFIHIAGEKKNEEKMHHVNVEGTAAILTEIIKYPHIKLLHVSSAGIYGIEKHPLHNLTEGDQLFPNNKYEKSKYEAEKVIVNNKNQSTLKYTIIRPTNVFGEHDKGNKLLTLFKAINKNKFFLLNPKAIVNYVYVGHVSQVIKTIIDNDIFDNAIFNINSHCTIEDFSSTIKTALHSNKTTIKIPTYFFFVFKLMAFFFDILPTKYQFFNSGKYRELTSTKYYSTEKLNKIIQLDETKSLKEGLINFVNHYKDKKLL